MKKWLLIILPLAIVLNEACSDKNCRLVVQNLSELDSLQVVVSVNGSELFNEKVAKAISNFDAAAKNISITTRKIHVSVNVPQLKVTETADSTIDDVKVVYIIVDHAHFSDTSIITSGSDILKRTRVSISLRNKIENGKAI
jgi:hypothetical protein